MAILHSVFFYFLPETPASVIEEQRTAILSELSTIKTVSWIKAGAPVGIDRDVVDNEYGMSLHLETASKETLQSYQTDPVHLSFVGKFKPYWSKIRVFDTAI
jgi:hypothetical protein